MKNNERSIKFYDLKLSARGRHNSTPYDVVPSKLKDLVDAWAALFQGQPLKRDWGLQHWSISPLTLGSDSSYVAFLVSRSDPQGADQALSNPKAGKFQVVRKGAGEGNAFSSHVVIKLDPVRPNHYLMLVEDTPGISASLVEKFLAFIMKVFAKGKPDILSRVVPSGATDKFGNAIHMRLQYRFELRAHPSDDFKQELNSGTLSGIEVVKTSNRTFVWDDDSATVEKNRVIHLVPAPANLGPFYGTLASVCKTAAKQKYEEVRIKFTNSSKYSRSVSIDPTDMSILNEERFIKKVRLENFQTKLDTAYQQFHQELLSRMVYLLN